MHNTLHRVRARRDFLRYLLLIFSAGSLGLNKPVFAASLSEVEWFQRLSLLRGFEGSFQFSIAIKSYQGKNIADESKVDVLFRSHQQVLIIFRAPQTVVGRRILVDGNDMWLSVPSSNRILRVSPSQRLLGEASNGDVINTNFADYSLVEEGVGLLEGASVIRLKFLSHSQHQTYQSIEYLIDSSTLLPRKSFHYSALGKLLKEIHYEQYKNIRGQDMLHTLRLVNPMLKDRSTLMILNNFEVKNFANGLFRKDNLLDLMI